jgi:hypothetical protein
MFDHPYYEIAHRIELEHFARTGKIMRPATLARRLAHEAQQAKPTPCPGVSKPNATRKAKPQPSRKPSASYADAPSEAQLAALLAAFGR